MINKDFLKSISPVEIQMVHQYIGVLFKDKIKDDTSNFDNLKAEKCPYCGSVHFVRNGRDPKSKRQRYICRDCKTSFKDSTDTFFSHSRVSYNTWMTFIGCEHRLMISVSLHSIFWQLKAGYTLIRNTSGTWKQ